VQHRYLRDGEYPNAGLINVNNTLYGTTYGGGAYDDGTVFSITTSGKTTVLHSFGMTGDGEYPNAGLFNVNGTLYGTTFEGGGETEGGTVFAITTSGKETVLHRFTGSGDGEYPNAGLIDVGGTLYGTTPAGAQTTAVRSSRYRHETATYLDPDLIGGLNSMAAWPPQQSQKRGQIALRWDRRGIYQT
jgi:uncharacterized repeat protein (TIGR03803 family)